MSNGRELLAIDARFGAPGWRRTTASSGFSKVANDYSTLFNVPMYWSMYFSGGQAIHFSFYFQEDGYYGAPGVHQHARLGGDLVDVYNLPKERR